MSNLDYKEGRGDYYLASRPQGPRPGRDPEHCCMCRWVEWGEECGHPESDGITSTHDHCSLHAVAP